MARILDTTPAFESFAKKAFLESPVLREHIWRERYESAHPEVFTGFYARNPRTESRGMLLTELNRVRERVRAALPVVRDVVEQVEPKVREVLGLSDLPEPLHVLMVGPYSTSAAVGRVEDDVALFHCLEWFQSREGSEVLVAHEDAHAWHELVMGSPPPTDAAWTAFSEGLATRVSREAVPGRAEDDYFWYGHPGFEDWLPWCVEHRDELLERFRDALDEPETAEAFFGAGLVEKKWRVGYFVADHLVGGLGRPLSELVRLAADEARALVRGALGLG